MKQITDHILTLQNSLVYHEGILSQWSSTYISQLRTKYLNSNNKADVNLLCLSTVGACCQVSQVVIGRLTAFCI